MLTLDEFIELREQLINNEVRAEFVKKKLELHWDKLKEGKRSWQTKDWKERRDKFLPSLYPIFCVPRPFSIF